MNDFINSMVKRRSIYSIGNTIPIEDEVLKSNLEKIIKNMPTSFNMQSTRMVLLLAQHHKKLWSITLETLRKIVPPENFSKTQAKIEGFAAGYGTILFFDDSSVVEKFQNEFPLYKDAFPVWALEQSGMLHFAVWAMLSDMKIGASLQHYNPLIDESVQKEWNLPKSWTLLAQMPFGKIEGEANEKTFEPVESRFLSFE